MMKLMYVVLALATVVISVDAQDKRSKGEGPKVGEAAPDFKIKMLSDGKTEVQLSSFKDKKPVILIFGSYT
jgi:peroxiredoxin